MRYIALLRGINIGGHNVKMDELRTMFSDLKLKNVRSYIQTGNVFFETDRTDESQLSTEIEEHLHKVLGYTVPVFLRSEEEIAEIIAFDPFKNVKITPDERLCVMFFTEPLPTNLTLPLKTPKNDLEVISTTKREAFVIWHIIDGRPPSPGGFLDKTLGARNTTRFFHTLIKILEASRAS